PAEQPSRLVPRGSCLIHNWQEERATNHLDSMPGQEPGSEGFAHRHGHHGVLGNTGKPAPPCATHPWKEGTLLRVPARGGGHPRPEGCGVCSAGRKEMLEEICPRRMPMESVSTTHRDYCAGGCQFMPLSTTQPHNYCTEQPCSFWLEQARSLPAVTSICSGDSPFRRNTAFSTPITK
ncbi:SPAG8 protein, partial [Thalassarche chlororhynchos]|nr:SPAG8 protein [Thalassarche chlororhynchos]